jgi:hypothetical protein
MYKNRGSRGSVGGSLVNRECVERLEYGRDSVRGQRDSRKLVPVVRTACQAIVSSNCLRDRRRFPRAVSTRGRKNISSPIVSPDTRTNRTNRNSIHCTSLGKRSADMWRKTSLARVELVRGSGPVHLNPDRLSRLG